MQMKACVVRWCKRGYLVMVTTAMLVMGVAHADTVYVSAEQFLQDACTAKPGNPEVLWLTPDLQSRIKEVLGHPYPGARLRYWKEGQRLMFIVDEIGKEYPITAGFVVNTDKTPYIERARVLVYREARGAEIHQNSFLKQFDGAALTADQHLSKRIDGITGATMSVDSMDRMAKAVLVMSQAIVKKP